MWEEDQGNRWNMGLREGQLRAQIGATQCFKSLTIMKTDLENKL